MYLVVLETHTTIREDDNLLIVQSYLFSSLPQFLGD